MNRKNIKIHINNRSLPADDRGNGVEISADLEEGEGSFDEISLIYHSKNPPGKIIEGLISRVLMIYS